MEQPSATSLDNATTIDRLGFDVYVRQICTTIRDATARKQLPLTIGVYGRWGSGKTSLMKMVAAELTGATWGRTPEANLNAPNVEGLPHRTPTGSRRTRLIALGWALLLLVGLIIAPEAAALITRLNGLARPISVIAWLAAWFGSFGGLTQILFRSWQSGRNVIELHWWYQLRPLTGLFIGAIVFLIAGSIITGLGGDLQHPVAATVIYVLAFLSGWFEVVLSVNRNRQARDDYTQVRGPLFQVIWFNAWKFAKEDELWAALLQRVLSQMQINAYGWAQVRIRWALWSRSIEWKSGALDIARKLWPTIGKTLLAVIGIALSSWLAQFIVGNVGGDQAGQAAGTATGLLAALTAAANWFRTNVATPLADVDLDKYRQKSSYKDHLTFLDEFSQEFKQITSIANRADNPIVLMLDDLDRCLPEQAVSVLEAIKLFVGDDAPVVFLIGADREFVERAIEVKYKDLIDQSDSNAPHADRFAHLGHEYLEKIVQLPFNLPPIEDKRIDQFIDDTFSDDVYVKDYSEIFATGLLPNPRQVLRVINIYRFVAGLANENRDLYFGKIDLAVLAKLVIIQYRWPDLYADLIEHTDLLEAFERNYAGTQPTDPDLVTLVGKHEARRGLKQLVTMQPRLSDPQFDPKKANVHNYLFITARAQQQPPPVEQTAQKQAPSTSKAAAFSTQAERDTLNEAVQHLRDQVAELQQRSADSALIGRLLEGLSRIDLLLKTEDYSSVDVVVRDIKPLADEALTELKARAQTPTPQTLQLNVTASGQLLFQRAITYERMDISIGLLKDGRLNFNVATARHDSATWQSESVKASPPYDLPTLKDQLGRALFNDQLLRLSQFSDPNARLRIRFIVDDPEVNALTWETTSLPDRLMQTEQRSPFDLILGLNPRFSCVRGTPNFSPLPPLRVSSLRMLIAIASPNDRPPKDVSALHAAFQSRLDAGLSVTWLESVTPTTLHDAIKKGLPQIVHLVIDAESDTNTLRLQDDSGAPLVMSPMDFAGMFSGAGVRVMVLDGNNSADIAPRFAQSIGVPIVVGWQVATSDVVRNAFNFAFYNALLRTGQADFAITEGRRAVAAAIGPEVAIWPVMVLNADDGLAFTN